MLMTQNPKEASTQLHLPVVNNPPFRTGKAHVSFSEVLMWIGCSWKHKLVHIDKLIGESQTVHTVFGTIIHEALEEWALVKEPQSVTPEWKSEWVDRHRANLGMNLRSLLSVEDEGNPGVVLGELSVKEWKDVLGNILTEFPGWYKTNLHSKGWRVVAAEKRLYEPIAGTGLYFKGFIDLVLKNSETGKWLILDFKTTGPKGWSDYQKTDPKKIMQLALYKRYLSNLLQIPEENVHAGFVFLTREQEGDAAVSALLVKTPSEVVEAAVEQVKTMIATVRKGWYSKNRGSCLGCHYYGTEACP